MEKVKQAIKKLYDLFIEKSDLIGYIVLGAFFIYLNLELYIRMEYLVESDMSSELVLARILAQEKKIFTTSWYYSTEIRILNYNLVFAPLFLLTDNWHIIRIVGIIILDLILFSSYYYLAKQLNIKHIPWIGFLIIGSVSREYFLRVTLGSHYISYFVIAFYSIGLLISIFNEKSRTKLYLKLCILLTLVFVDGMQGMRMVTLTYLPLVATTILYCFINQLDYLRKGKINIKEETIKWVFICVLCFVVSYMGAYINSHVLPEMGYSFSTGDSEAYYQEFTFDALGTVINGWLTDLGYQSDNLFVFIPTQLILKPLFALFFLILCWASWDIFKHREKYTKYEFLIFLYYIVAGIFTSALFVFTDLWYRDRYILPVSVFSTFIIGIFISHYRIKWQKWLMIMVIVTYIAINTRFLIHYETDNSRFCSMIEIRDILLKNGCYNGYSIDHWNGHNILTELSDGKIETWRFYGDDIDKTASWLQAKDHRTKKPTGKVYLLLLKEEYGQVSFNKDVTKNIFYQDDERTMYIFESYEELKEITSQTNETNQTD